MMKDVTDKSHGLQLWYEVRRLAYRSGPFQHEKLQGGLLRRGQPYEPHEALRRDWQPVGSLGLELRQGRLLSEFPELAKIVGDVAPHPFSLHTYPTQRPVKGGFVMCFSSDNLFEVALLSWGLGGASGTIHICRHCREHFIPPRERSRLQHCESCDSGELRRKFDSWRHRMDARVYRAQLQKTPDKRKRFQDEAMTERKRGLDDWRRVGEGDMTSSEWLQLHDVRLWSGRPRGHARTTRR
jgi:hypothetical protein